MYLHAKYPHEPKYHYLINKRKKVGLDHFNNPKAFMEYSMICCMPTEMLKITIQIKKEKY